MTKIAFTPDFDAVVDICFSNVVIDASWSYKPKPREISLTLKQIDGTPRNPDPQLLVAMQRRLDTSHKTLRSRIRQQFHSVDKGMKYLLRRERQLRDLNEDSLNKLNLSLFLFAISSFVFQFGAFAVLRKLAQRV
jgi:hypothetical protein